MLGRAGRPGYDDVGYGWVVCDRADADKYRALLREGKEIESRLAAELESHLNAEIAMGTIRGLEDVMEWLETTFYYVRAESKPDEYEFATLRDRVRDTLESLVVDDGFVAADDDLAIEPTGLGRLASKYYLRLDTARRFRRLADHETLTVDSVLETVASAGEFDSVSARSAESDAIDRILDGRDTDLEDGHRKVFAILLAGMADSIPPRTYARTRGLSGRTRSACSPRSLSSFSTDSPAPAAKPRVPRRGARRARRLGRPSRSPRSTGSAPAAPSASRGRRAHLSRRRRRRRRRSAENAGMSGSVAERIVDAARDCPPDRR